MLLKKYEKIRTTKTREVKILTYKKHIHSFTLQILDEIDVPIIIDQSLNRLIKKTVQVFLAFVPCTGRIRVISTSNMVCWWRILSVIFGDGWLNERNTFRAFDMPIFNRMIRTRKTCTWSVMDVPELDWKQRFLPASPWELTLKIDSNEEYHVCLWMHLYNLDFVTGKWTSHPSHAPTLMMTTRIHLASLIDKKSTLTHTTDHRWNCREHVVCWQGKCSTCSNTEQALDCSRQHSGYQTLISPKTSKLRVVPFFAWLPSSKACVTHVKIDSKWRHEPIVRCWQPSNNRQRFEERRTML
jgi:hypothetical protein